MAGEEIHREPFVHLAELSHDRALIGWGAFWFQRRDAEHRWDVVDDEALQGVAGWRTCIGSGAEPYGTGAVRVRDESGRVVAEESTGDRTWVWVRGLAPNTAYHYEVLIDGAPWPADENR